MNLKHEKTDCCSALCDESRLRIDDRGRDELRKIDKQICTVQAAGKQCKTICNRASEASSHPSTHHD